MSNLREEVCVAASGGGGGRRDGRSKRACATNVRGGLRSDRRKQRPTEVGREAAEGRSSRRKKVERYGSAVRDPCHGEKPYSKGAARDVLDVPALEQRHPMPRAGRPAQPAPAA